MTHSVADLGVAAVAANGNGHGHAPPEEELPPLTGADSPEDPPPQEDDPLAAAEAFVAPSALNASRTMNACRFLLDHGCHLVLAWGDDVNPADVWAIGDTGRLEVGPLLSMFTRTARRYLAGCLGLDKADFGVASRDASSLDSAEGWSSVKRVLRPGYDRLMSEGLVPEGISVINRDDIDANLRYMGAPNGVIDLHTAERLSPEEVVERQAFVHCQIPDDYDPEATHPAVDIIMPEEPATPEMAWWYKMRGVMLLRKPSREAAVQMNAPGSGKTTVANGDRAAFGPSYVTTCLSGTFTKPRFSAGPSGHNSGLFMFKSPVRIVYLIEADAELHPELVNAISGGEVSTPARDVGEKMVVFHATGHLVIQANLPEDGDESGVKLNIGRRGETNARAALMDRLKFVAMPVIPPEKKDGGFPEGSLRDGFLDAEAPEDARLRRQAWVARSVRQAAAMAGKVMPPPLKAMEDLAEARRMEELLPWEREWLPTALVPLKEHGAEAATPDRVYESYMAWHARIEGKVVVMVGKRTIGNAVKKLFGAAESTWIPEKKKADRIHRGWMINTGERGGPREDEAPT